MAPCPSLVTARLPGLTVISATVSSCPGEGSSAARPRSSFRPAHPLGGLKSAVPSCRLKPAYPVLAGTMIKASSGNRKREAQGDGGDRYHQKRTQSATKCHRKRTKFACFVTRQPWPFSRLKRFLDARRQKIASWHGICLLLKQTCKTRFRGRDDEQPDPTGSPTANLPLRVFRTRASPAGNADGSVASQAERTLRGYARSQPEQRCPGVRSRLSGPFEWRGSPFLLRERCPGAPASARRTSHRMGGNARWRWSTLRASPWHRRRLPAWRPVLHPRRGGKAQHIRILTGFQVLYRFVPGMVPGRGGVPGIPIRAVALEDLAMVVVVNVLCRW